MKTIKLTVNQLYALQDELNSILSMKLSLLAKYTLSEIKKPVDEFINDATKAKDDFITEFGEKDDKGQVTLKFYINEETKELNPQYVNFTNEWNKILNTEKELNYNPIPLSFIEKIETEKNIEVLFSLVEKPE